MIYLAIIIGCVVGAIIGINAPVIPYSFSIFLAIGVVAALDSVLGGVSSILNKNFDFKIFISGFFCNAILAMLLTYLGQKLNIDIYIAAIFVFINRMFINLTIIRRHYVEKWSKKLQNHYKSITK